MAQKDSDLQKIQELVEIMKANDLAEIEISHGDDKFLVKRAQPPQPIITGGGFAGSQMPPAGPQAVQQASGGVQQDQEEEGLVDITSPIVGTFYAQPSPDSDAFVEVGSRVDQQTVVGIVEAMKVMNEIKAETSGAITKVCVKNGQAVEYGQVLFKVRPE